jgi:hypothetical protein
MQHYTSKTEDWATRIELKTGGELSYSGKVSSSCYHSDTRRVTVKTKITGYVNVLSKPYKIQSIWKGNKW